VAVPAGDRTRLEHLCRYVLRPPVAQDALELTDGGKILLTMRRAWHDGTRAILFEPHELIEKLAALIPKPRVNLLLYHGVLGPSARLRSGAVAASGALDFRETGACVRASEDDESVARSAVANFSPMPIPLRDGKGREAPLGSGGQAPRDDEAGGPVPGPPWAALASPLPLRPRTTPRRFG
jgi:hypothetical protein